MTQSRFRSRTEHVLDEKGRLNLPARFREVLRQSGSDILMVAPWKNRYVLTELLNGRLWRPNC